MDARSQPYAKFKCEYKTRLRYKTWSNKKYLADFIIKHWITKLIGNYFEIRA